MGSKSEHKFLKLEPIKQELSFTISLEVSGSETQTVDADGNPLTAVWYLTSGNPSFSGLTNGVLLQFCEYNPKTKIEKELFHTDFSVGSSNSVSKSFTYGTDDYTLITKYRGFFGKLAFRLKVSSNNTFREDIEPYLKVYVLPANYVTKQVRLSNIQAYWQDPIHPHAMWLQLEDWVTTGTGPYSVTVTTGPPATLTQTALVSDAVTGSELYHNIIPYLDTIMTYEN